MPAHKEVPEEGGSSYKTLDLSFSLFGSPERDKRLWLIYIAIGCPNPQFFFIFLFGFF